MRKVPLLIALVAISCLNISEAAASKGPVSRRSIGGYEFATYEYFWKGVDGHVLEIWKGKKKLREMRAHDLWIYSLDKQAESFELKPTDPVIVRDLTGDGVKDVIIQSWSGGAHCCYTFDVFSLGKELHRIWHHEAGNGHLFVSLVGATGSAATLARKSSLPTLEVQNDAEHIRTGAPLSDMPLDIYRWSSGKFRVVRRNVPHHVD